MKTQKFMVILSLLVSVFVVSTATAGSWSIDTGHSTVGFKVRHLFSNVSGTFDKWEGTIDFDPANPEKASIDVTIDATSINTKHEDRDGHLKSPDFFDVEAHPTITFKSTKVTKSDHGFKMVGDLTMRGVTKSVTIPVSFAGSGPHPMMDGMVAGFSAELTLNRKDFGISWNRVLDAGGTILGEDVTVMLEIEATQPNS